MNKPAPDALCTTCGHPCNRHAHPPMSNRIGHCLDCSVCQKFTVNAIASSGEHSAVKGMRKKFDSIAEHTVPRVEALNSQIDDLSAAISSSPPPEEDIPDTEPEGISPDGPTNPGDTS